MPGARLVHSGHAPNDGVASMTRTRIFCLTMLLALSSFAAFPAAATDLCAGHTDGDRKTCEGTCPSGAILGVYINLDDHSEDGEAATTCSNANAQCETTSHCSDESEVATATQASWVCHFEAHDVWYQPDNGFTYNCFYYYPEGGECGSNEFVFAKSDVDLADGVSCSTFVNCNGIVPQMGELESVTLDGLCGSVQTDALLLPFAAAQVLVRVDGPSAVGLSCVAGASCEPVVPVCVFAIDGFFCDVATPGLPAQ